jgi:ribose 5-phosphate isomerase B
MNVSLAIASDHAGFELKQRIKAHLQAKGIRFDDLGAYSAEPSDYPDFGHRIGEAIASGDYRTGITICGSGNGINMVANKHRGVRGAICWNQEISEMARRHNDANICSLPARYIDESTALEIVDIFLETEFDGGRHEKRIKKIDP